MHFKERDDIDYAWNRTLRLNNIEKGQFYTIDSIMNMLPLFQTGQRINPNSRTVVEGYVYQIKSNNSTTTKQKLRSILAKFAEAYFSKVVLYDYSINDPTLFQPYCKKNI